MFDALLRMHLGPIIERLAQMETELEDLHRRAESFCRIGICQEVDAASNTCKVSHGGLLTPAIRFFNPSAERPERVADSVRGRAMPVAEPWRRRRRWPSGRLVRP